MTERTELQCLIEQVEKLTGPDRGVDLALAQALVPDVIVMRQRDDDTGTDPYTHWQYTASIDAAVALIERLVPDAYWEIGRTAVLPGMMPGSDPNKYYALVGRWGWPKKGSHDTKAIALILALLRSLTGGL